MKKGFIFKGGIIALCIPFLASCNTSKDLKSLQDEANYTLNLSSSNIEFKENDYSSSEEKIKAINKFIATYFFVIRQVKCQ